MKRLVTVELYAPFPFGDATCSFWADDKDARSGGCGPGDGIGDRLIPDHLLGLSIKWACAIHDWCYLHGQDDKDKRQADKIFRQNMKRIVREAGGFLKAPRYTLAKVYYGAVKFGGETAYWNAKHREDMHEVVI